MTFKNATGDHVIERHGESAQCQSGTMGCELKWLGSDVSDASVTGSISSWASLCGCIPWPLPAP